MLFKYFKRVNYADGRERKETGMSSGKIGINKKMPGNQGTVDDTWMLREA